jgi:hypothetical protein
MPRIRVVSRIPVVSRLVVMMAGALLAVSALIGLPDGSAPGYSTVAYSTMAYSTVGDTSPATSLSTAKCKKKCKRYRVSDSDLKNLSDNDVAALGTVIAVIALAAVI